LLFIPNAVAVMTVIIWNNWSQQHN